MTQLKFHPDDTIHKGDAFFSIELKDWDVDGDYDSSIGLYGWCFSPVIPRGVNVEWYIGGCLLTSVPLNIPRPDIFLRFSFNEQCGFHFRVSKYMLPPDGRLDVSLWGVDVDGQRARLPLGQVEFLNVSRPPLRYSERSRPLILTGAGRSGTSMIINLLSFHPEIVIPGPPPHELRTATWLWQAAQVLSALAMSNLLGRTFSRIILHTFLAIIHTDLGTGKRPAVAVAYFRGRNLYFQI